MASKGLSGAAPVLEGYGLSCEHDLSLLVQEDLDRFLTFLLCCERC